MNVSSPEAYWKFSIPLLITMFFSAPDQLHSQGVYTPVTDLVYEFLDKMQVKGVTDYTKLVMPKTRNQIGRYLTQIDSSRGALTLVEREELDRYRQMYLNESEILSTSVKPHIPSVQELDQEGFHLFKYRDPKFKLAVYPIVGISIESRYDEIQGTRWNGLSADGSFGDNIGAQTDFRDYVETGNKLDLDRRFSKSPGIIPITSQSSGNSIGYSEVKGALTYESPWLSVSVGREWFNWGSGYNSQLILSQKAPPFHYLRIDFTPVDWFRFYYLHGWLASNIIDSLNSYPTQVPGLTRVIDRPKYYAAHMLELTPFNGFSFSLGESVVYSDQGPLLGFLIPVLFFRTVDQNTYDRGVMGRGSNSQVFFDLNIRPRAGINCYATWFIDEIDLGKIFNWPNNRNQFGVTIGGTTQDMLLDDFTARLEYTRILPWVYSNFIQTQTYTNSGYLMGDYIGQNADQIFIQFEYRVTKGLAVKIWGEGTRRGGMDSVYYQYQPEARPFLHGPKRQDIAFGFEASYELILNFLIKADYEYRYVTDEDPSRTPSYQLGVHHTLGITFYYYL